MGRCQRARYTHETGHSLHPARDRGSRRMKARQAAGQVRGSRRVRARQAAGQGPGKPGQVRWIKRTGSSGGAASGAPWYPGTSPKRWPSDQARAASMMSSGVRSGEDGDLEPADAQRWQLAVVLKSRCHVPVGAGQREPAGRRLGCCAHDAVPGS